MIESRQTRHRSIPNQIGSMLLAIVIWSNEHCLATDVPVHAESPEAVDFRGSAAGDLKQICPEINFHWCPAGTFEMGQREGDLDEGHVEVTLSDGFWMAETEVTQGQFQKIMKSSPWRGLSNVKRAPENAASYVNFADATMFCQKMTKLERTADRLPSNWKYTLPTEAQWEYACRAGTKTKFSFGDDESMLNDHGWYLKNAVDFNEEYAHPAGQKKPNAWGLKDMHGNVREWCLDWFNGLDQKPPGGLDPLVTKFPPQGQARRSRGGCFLEKASSCRSAYRGADSPFLRQPMNGFRVIAINADDEKPAKN